MNRSQSEVILIKPMVGVCGAFVSSAKLNITFHSSVLFGQDFSFERFLHLRGPSGEGPFPHHVHIRSRAQHAVGLILTYLQRFPKFLSLVMSTGECFLHRVSFDKKSIHLRFYLALYQLSTSVPNKADEFTPE